MDWIHSAPTAQMGKLRPGRVEWLALGHTERPCLFQNLLLLLWALLNCGLGVSAQ